MSFLNRFGTLFKQIKFYAVSAVILGLEQKLK